jgi:anti-anti-sigma factor
LVNFSNDLAGNFSTELAQTGDATMIYVRGEIDIATCERLRDAIEPHLGPGQSVILDLDSSGLHVLGQARGVLTADGGSLVLRNPSEAAHRLLTVTETEDLLEADADAHPDEHSN